MQQLNDELDVSIGWHTWQFLRKNIWVVLNNSNIIQRCSLHSVEYTELVN
jgi:hypothetical protein